jgi:FkbM family methyltransferase
MTTVPLGQEHDLAIQIAAMDAKLRQIVAAVAPRNRLLFHDSARGALTLNIDGLVIRFPDSEVAHALSYALNDQFDRGMQLVLHRLLRPGMTFVDVGASVGVLTALGARLVGSAGRVFAYEPIGVLEPFIRANVSINAPTTRFELAPAAVGSVAGTLEFQTFEGDSRISTLFKYDSNWLPGIKAHFLTVPTFRLDDHLPHGIPVQVIKIDAEGAEFDVLKGMENVMRRSPDLQIVAEWAPEHFQRAGHDMDTVQAFLVAHQLNFCGLDPLTGEDVAANAGTFVGNARLHRATDA